MSEYRCDEFNAAFPVGSEIAVWPGAVRGSLPVIVSVVEPGAYMLGGHTAVVHVSGGYGCIALTHVKGVAP